MTTHEKLRQLTLTSLFIALVVLFGMTPLGLIPVGTLNATILHIPVIIGVIALGLKPGLILGLAFGLVSTLRAFNIPLPASPLVDVLMDKSPLLVVAMSIVPRPLVPLAAYLIARLPLRGPKRYGLLCGAGLAGSATNTVFYLGLMLVFYGLMGLDNAAIIATITGSGAVQGALEAALAAIIVPPVVLALEKIQKRK